MRIAFIAPPFETPWLGKNTWVTVPPVGYGGIQWIMKNIMDALIEDGHELYLLGAPGSVFPKVKVIPIGKIPDISDWLIQNRNSYDIIHDHSCRGEEFSGTIEWGTDKKIHSHYLSSSPKEVHNLVAASHAHAEYIGFPNIPVIRHPVNPNNYLFKEQKDDYLLYLGRISSWKGAKEAAIFAKKAGIRLIMAGPAWEKEYFNEIQEQFSDTVDYVGEVGGKKRLELLSRAKAVLVFSQDVEGPSGKVWCEPGSQVVSESAICGTPIISSFNGCLKEIVPFVGKCIENVSEITSEETLHILDNLPSPQEVRDVCKKEWNYRKIAAQYCSLYLKVLNNENW